MKCKKRFQKNDLRPQRSSRVHGQAITEFVLGLMIMVSFFFFFIKMAMVFAIGNYVHYVTFMAARAYTTSHSSASSQEEAGEMIFNQMIKSRWKKIIIPVGGANTPGATVGPGKIVQDNPLNQWNYGATFTYSTKLELYPFSTGGASVDLKLTSESWMPREEAQDECLQTKASIQANVNGAVGRPIQVEWDGC